MRLVVVIPTLNEADALARLVDRLLGAESGLASTDVFVSDSGSTDSTWKVAVDSGCGLVGNGHRGGRGLAIRRGVEHALLCRPDAEGVWILHADCLPPSDAAARIAVALQDSRVVGGAFEQRFAMTDCSWWVRRQLRFVVFLNRLRYRRSGIYFGDQGIFARVETLKAVDGVPAWGLFEDVELCHRLKSEGELVLLPDRLTTSPRRFVANGPFRQLIHDAGMLCRHRFRGDGHRFAAAYSRNRG